jgi:hypothetical protein
MSGRVRTWRGPCERRRGQAIGKTLEIVTLCSHWTLRAIVRRVATGGAALALCALEAVTVAARAEPPAPQETPFICAQVVLAIDGSKSTGESAFNRQIEGLRAAFGREPLYRAIQDCLPGSVAFAVMTWSGAEQQGLCLNWALVTNVDDGQHVAEQFARCRYFGGSTDIGRAVDYGLGVLEKSPFASYYRTVLILTNGRTDRGAEASLADARARAATAAVTLAGYALLRPEPEGVAAASRRAARPLDRYVAEHVSGGPRAFTAYSRPGDDPETLLRALIEMLRQEAS